MASPKIEWQAYDRLEQHHRPDWYWAVGIIALSITVTSVLLNNVLFAVLVVISTIALFLRTLQKPQLVCYELTSRGLWAGKEFSPFSSFESFWVTENEPAKLIIKSKGIIIPLSVIPLADNDPQTIRDFLQDYLPEVEHQEPLSKHIMEYLGF
ncbi:MAG: hypothetical protein AAB767_03035 [Patescibacteria group bacterium]